MQDWCNDWMKESCVKYTHNSWHTVSAREKAAVTLWTESSLRVGFLHHIQHQFPLNSSAYGKPATLNSSANQWKSTVESLETHYVQGLIMCRQPDFLFHFLDSGPSLHPVCYLIHVELFLPQHRRWSWREKWASEYRVVLSSHLFYSEIPGGYIRAGRCLMLMYLLSI